MKFGFGKKKLNIEEPEIEMPSEEISSEALNDENTAKADQPMISIKGLYKAYGEKQVLKGLNLEVYSGELFGFIGKNGIGKSTTIDCVIGSKKFDDGTQFILITHRRGTMEIGDRLYGVTMPQRGISQAIELNVNEIEGKQKELLDGVL